MAIDQTSSHSDENSHHHGLIGMILDVAVRFRWAIIVLTIFAAIYGAFNLLRLPIDRSIPARLRFRLLRWRRR